MTKRRKQRTVKCPGCGQNMSARRKRCDDCRVWDKRVPWASDTEDSIPAAYCFPVKWRSRGPDDDDDIERCLYGS